MKKSERIQMMTARFAEMRRYEEQLWQRGIEYIAGVDEVGRGPLAGPVVAAAVILPYDFDEIEVNDSKKLSEKKREELYIKIEKKAIAIGIGMKDNLYIDKANILQATKVAMLEALTEAEKQLTESGKKLEHILIDAVRLESAKIPQTSIIKGDASSISIAAASIIAKVTRDRMMREYHKQYPGYAFESNKGYGTKAHYEGLSEIGMCPIHRKTFLRNLRMK
ncbi:MAG: ribonuclease HII [Eubacteriales bacterium]|nr:ribonuclease HII [Eubacteriales bacterium]MDD4389527.1 ribonuclease HII [Eubacteriales bacterium]